jgi:hypothetical protein
VLAPFAELEGCKIYSTAIFESDNCSNLVKSVAGVRSLVCSTIWIVNPWFSEDMFFQLFFTEDHLTANRRPALRLESLGVGSIPKLRT